MSLVIVTAPTTFPVTVDEAKAQCFATGTSDFDALLTSYIAAATDAAEQYLSKAVAPQRLRLVLDDWSDFIELPKGPVSEIHSVTYFDTAGLQQTLDPSAYSADLTSSPQWIARPSGLTWPDLLDGINGVSIEYTTGYGAACPASIKQAILMLVAFWFSNRESVNIGNIVNEVPMAWKHLLDPHAMVVL